MNTARKQLDNQPPALRGAFRERIDISPLYTAVMEQFELRRVSLEFPMEKFSEYAGLPERYYPKAKMPNCVSGRQATWPLITAMSNVLYADGFDLTIVPRPGTRQAEILAEFWRRYPRRS
jgi:hypothetical protein